MTVVAGLVPVLAVSPGASFIATGQQSGPFGGSPNSYTVQNSGAGTLNWAVTGPSWLTFSPTSGALAAGASTTVNVTVNTADAAAATAGSYSGTIAFSSNGGSATRTANLTVTDSTPPVIANFPGNITVYTPAGSATAVATWTAPTATDNVGVTSLMSNYNPGDSFPIGVTTVTYTAKDAANNMTAASFTVTVIDNVVPVFGTCPANQTLEATTAAGTVAGWTVPTATDNSGAAPTITNNYSPGATFPLGTTTVIYSALDGSANSSSCSFAVKVQDTTPPVITGVPANITVNAPAASATAIVSWTAPTASDAVGVTSFTSNFAPGASFPIGTTTITYTAKDAANNTSTTSFTITVVDNTPPVLAGVPANVTVEATGPTGAIATYTMPTASDAVDGVVVVTTSKASGTTFPLGVTTISFTAKDAANNTATATFQVTVQDTTPPVITAVPANISVSAPAAGATALVSWTAPTASDAVGVTSFTSNFAPGASFPVGMTTVTYTAKDAANNTSTASFTVTVVDNTAPVFVAVPANITKEATGPAGTVVTYTMPTANDAVDGAVAVTTSKASGTTFPLGVTTVAFTAKDSANNTATATFQVTVQDTTPPVIGAVADITVTAPDLVGAIVTFPLPAATDSVDAAPSVSAAPTSGTLFTIGMHTVTVTAKDFSNNTSTKTFKVTVKTPASIAVTPLTGLAATGPQGQQGGAFSPASQLYTVTNNGDVPMNFTVGGGPAWAGASPAGGTLAAGASTNVTVALNATADAQTVGNYNGTFTFTNATSGIGTTTRTAALNVLAPAALTVTPATPFAASGPQGQQGGAFTPSSATFTLANNGAFPLAFTVAGAPAWVTLSQLSGTIPANGTTTVVVTLGAAANALAVGLQTGALAFNNATNGIGSTARGISLNVQQPAQLVVTPTDGLTASGFQGGPFSPASKTFTLTNPGAFPLSYTAAGNQGWFSVAPPSGTIPAGGSATVTATINAAANALAATSYSGTVTLTNAINGLGNATRPVALTVIPNGQVILKVVTSQGDGTFKFSSATTALNQTVTSSGGSAQSAPVTLNPGNYNVAVTLPDGFGLTGVTCSDNDSAGSVPNKSAAIALSPAEAVTCTFTSTNSRAKTVQVIQRFMSQRNDLLLSNGPDADRQIDRLIAAGGDGSGSGGAPVSLADSGNGNAASAGSRASGLAGGFGGANGTASSLNLGQSPTGQPPTGGRLARTESLADQMLGPLQRDPNMSRGYDMLNPNASNDGNQRFAFATSLSKMQRDNAEAEQKKIREGLSGETMHLGNGNLPSSKPKFSPFDIWIEAKYASYRDDRAQTDSSGHFGVVYVGADYVLSPKFLIGMLAQFDSMRQRSGTGAFDIEGRGWMVGPYATLRLSENVFLQGRAAAGRSQNTVSPFMTYSDTFTTSRWLATATLAGRWKYGDWHFRPSATVAYIEDVSTAYTDSLGVVIPNIRTSLGQAKFGPEVAYRMLLADGIIVEPRAGVQAIWNFATTSAVTDFGGTLTGPQDWRGKVEAGLKTEFPSGIALDIAASYDGLGTSTFRAVGGKATLRVPFN